MKKHNRGKLALTIDTVRRLADQSLTAAAGGGTETDSICPSVMQTHCQSLRNPHTCRCE
jgi:hypothetical protein